MATIIHSTKNGKPQYRVRWNYRNGRYDEKRFSDRRAAYAFSKEVTAGHSSTTETITVKQLGEEWLARHVDPTLELRTRKDYRCQFERRIKPLLGRERVARLTPARIAEWRDEMVALGVGGRTINKTLGALKAMVRWGRAEGLCANTMIDDARGVRTPKAKPANPYSPDQVAQIVAGCAHLRDATFVSLAAYSGLRWSELRGLRWSDIVDGKTITLTRSVDRDRTFKATKSDQHRIVPILGPGRDALTVWRGVAPDVDLVFPDSNGRPIDARHWYGVRLPAIRAACKIEFDLHELRDTYASILIQSGIGEAELTLWLGHRSIQTTLDRYGKLFEQRKAALVARADEALASL